MSTVLVYTRRWSFFAPPFTYGVTDATTSTWIGEVARNEGSRRWYASNKTWTTGGDLARTFPTRREAATALRFIADGHDPTTVGGYTPRNCS